MAEQPEKDTDQSPAESYRRLDVERCRYVAAVLQRIGLEMQDLATAVERTGPKELVPVVGPASDIVLACATSLQQCLVQVGESSGLPPRRDWRGNDWWAGLY